MIYIDTRRHFWRASQTVPRLFGPAMIVTFVFAAPQVAAWMLLAKLLWETRTFFDHSVSARLQCGPLAKAVLGRDLLALTSVVLLFTAPAWAALPLIICGELLERYLFFRAVDAPKMPGVPA
jgi:hypothetical protein